MISNLIRKNLRLCRYLIKANKEKKNNKFNSDKTIGAISNMFQELKALLVRYWLPYFRSPHKLLLEFGLALILGTFLAIRDLGIPGAICAFIFIFLNPFVFVVPTFFTLSDILEERSKGIKDYVKMNGVGTFTYQFYWILIANSKTMIYSLFFIIGFWIGNFLPSDTKYLGYRFDIDILEGVQFYALAALAMASFALFLSTLLPNSQMAPAIVFGLYFVASFITIYGLKERETRAFVQGLLFPQAALNMAMGSLPSHSEPYLIPANFFKSILSLDFGLYTVLYVILDWLMSSKKSTKQAKRVSTTLDLSTPLLNQESVVGDFAVYNEKLQGIQGLKKMLQVNHLTKKFNKSATAADDVSFSVYEGQIFCLLGDGSSGKTTILKMLAGMIGSDSGEVIYDDEEKQNKLGICLHTDVISEGLSVREHLEFVAKVRNIPFFDISEAVEKALSSQGLGIESRTLAGQLLLESKAKLSIAMAMIGQPRIILLDEPAAGLNVQSRRVIWQCIRQLKEQGLTVVFTTKNLEEAGELGERIALISKGKLLATETPEYFNKEFGVGSRLSITPITEKLDVETFCGQKAEVEKVVSGIIPGVKFEEQSASDILMCLLPFGMQKELKRLIAELEGRGNLKGNLMASTLEELRTKIERNLNGEERVHTEIKINSV